MAQHYFNRYIWLISTIKTNGPITLKELDRKWKESPLNETRDNLYERTFHNHRMAIEETFGIKISYTRPDGYYIDTNSLEDGSFREWMLDCLQVNNLQDTFGKHSFQRQMAECYHRSHKKQKSPGDDIQKFLQRLSVFLYSSSVLPETVQAEVVSSGQKRRLENPSNLLS